MSDLSIHFAGSGGSVPSRGRGLPATLILRGGEEILIDCGEGTQRQLLRSTGLGDIDDVFLTHLHADHWLGLPGLLKTLDLRGRERTLTVYGPRGTEDLVRGVMLYAGRTSYPLAIDELTDGDGVERDGYEIYAVAVQHRCPALAYVLAEDDRPGRFDPEAAVRAGLVPGPEFGRVQRGETVRGISPSDVMGEARAGRKLVFSGDTRPCDAIRDAAQDATVLVHEATFALADAERAHETGHSTATQAAGIARDAGVGLLALNHISIRYPVSEIRDEAREIFPNTVAPRDFDSIDVPMIGRGEPRLVRWSERQTAGAEPATHDVATELATRDTSRRSRC